MALRAGAEDRAIGVLKDGYLWLLRLAGLVDALGAGAGIDRSSQEPSHPARQLHFSAPRLPFTRHLRSSRVDGTTLPRLWTQHTESARYSALSDETGSGYARVGFGADS